jgi:DNA-directed RNA polymerase sigma subunit (sigma70/sigma32)
MDRCEADVITPNFKWNDHTALKLEEIGKLFSLTWKWVRQLKAKDTRCLRHTNRSQALKLFCTSGGWILKPNLRYSFS